MATYIEIKNENDPKTTIIKYAQELHEKTGRNVIVYYSGWLTVDDYESSIDSMDKNVFMTIIKGLDKSKGLDLILHTPGGAVSATESLIDYLHAIFGENIRAIIPQMAMSGGTMIACSCKEILMGKHSSLGPADPQIYGIPARTVIEEFELAKKEIEENPKSVPYWRILLDKYPVNFLFECKNSMDWAKEILEKSLKYSMFKDDNPAIIDKIVYELTLGEATKSHSRNLSPKKCREIGLKIKFIEEDEELQDLILSIHHACINYFNQKNVSKIY
ncbi:S49 family peptidase [uncultured Methanobrevibacter sp.]|uniref:SDH family Clp fold serine proteinase n=1 Tax=uncultured Methanobrevibacter sp. TaxID=253161 RepID=UPI002629D522|nr:S49 family peptidase [uncultured Methanobrevibacter sp.]